jgi:protein arginine kinase activator
MTIKQCPQCKEIAHLYGTVTDLMPNGSYKTIHICAECVRIYFQICEHKVKVINSVDGLLDFLDCVKYDKSLLACKCGITELDLEKNYQLGCPDCYEVFKDKLNEILKAHHGSSKHTGKVPNNTLKANKEDELKTLKLKYAKALELEKYEDCKKLKNQIDDLI